MLIKKDYSYITNTHKKLIEMDLADIGIHCLKFDRHFTEEQKEENRRQSYLLSKEEWNKSIENISENLYKNMLPIIELLNAKYDIHQFTLEKSSSEHYRSNWDLFFYSNRGWNNKDYFDCMTLSFNEKREIEENNKLLTEILDILNDIKYENIYCSVKYQTIFNTDKIKEKAKVIFENLQNKVINYDGMEGKLRLINNEYAFLKKHSKKTYYKVSDISLCCLV